MVDAIVRTRTNLNKNIAQGGNCPVFRGIATNNERRNIHLDDASSREKGRWETPMEATTEQIDVTHVPDVYIPMRVAEDLLASNKDRILLLASNGQLRVRRAPGGHRKFSIRDALRIAASS
jgi:hypothetical protein